jgi:hypothetical protein
VVLVLELHSQKTFMPFVSIFVPCIHGDFLSFVVLVVTTVAPGPFLSGGVFLRGSILDTSPRLDLSVKGRVVNSDFRVLVPFVAAEGLLSWLLSGGFLE